MDENSILSSLCACWTPEVLRLSRMTWAKSYPLPKPAGVSSDHLPVLVDAQYTVRRDALGGERPGDAHLGAVLVGLVVEVLVVGIGGDGGVDLLLAGDASDPPLGVKALRFVRPGLLGVAGNLPLLPRFAKHAVQLLSEGFQVLLRVLPDDVDLRVVGDVSQGDVGHPLVDEPLANIVVRGGFRGGPALDLRLLDLPVAAV